MLNNWSDNNEISNNLKVATFDFSTLFTTIPHDDLIRCIVALLNKYFSSDIVIHFENKKIILTKSKFVEILKFCISNSYILFDCKIYKQAIGIPMGANYSPNLANLYLHFYESRFMTLNSAEKRLNYRYVFRYIDDLFTVNNNSIFIDINNIYPPCLEMKNTNEAPYNKCTFLDIDIEVIDEGFSHKVYDKRRDYNFDILGLPSFNSNIPNSSTYGVLCSQVSRYAIICKFRNTFIENCQLFVDKLRQNGFPCNFIKKIVNRFELNKHVNLKKFQFNSKLVDLLII